MSDLKPFVHGEEGTHSACNTRLKEDGGKARCCSCVPHDGCEYPKEALPKNWGKIKVGDKLVDFETLKSDDMKDEITPCDRCDRTEPHGHEVSKENRTIGAAHAIMEPSDRKAEGCKNCIIRKGGVIRVVDVYHPHCPDCDRCIDGRCYKSEESKIAHAVAQAKRETIERIRAEVIGEDEEKDLDDYYEDQERFHKNELRAEQRTKLASLQEGKEKV